MLIILAAVLFFLILLICGNKGAKSIITTSINVAGILVMLTAINAGFPIFAVTAVSCIAITAVTLFYQNEVNIKSIASFWSVIAVLAIVLPLVFWLIHSASAAGFNAEEYEITDSNGYTRNVDISMPALQACVMITALLGVLIDTSVAITASVYEIKRSSEDISLAELMKSSFTVGRDVLNTSMHTIFYIYVAEYMTLMIQYIKDYSFSYVINSKSLAGEFLTVSLSGVGCCLIVPVSALL
ncbi:MAG: YibE/F family protein, partial [Anaerovoracaceae bacterium]